MIVRGKVIMVIRETQFHASQDESDDWPPSNGVAFVTWFLRKFDNVPKEFAQSIEVILSSETDDDVATLSIEYNRPPSKAEEEEASKLALEKSERVRLRELD